MKRFILICLLLIVFIGSGSCENGFGGKVGITFQLGTHVRRIGVMYQLYYFQELVQVSHGSSFQYVFKGLGPSLKRGEIQTFGGVQFYGGSSTDYTRYMLNEYSLMVGKTISGGYIWRYYFDQIKTSQATGGIQFTANGLTVVIENDLFGFYKGHHDKYRTGAFAVMYAHNRMQVALQSTLWTGNARESEKVRKGPYPSRYGYKDLSKASYGNLSHGILAFRFDGIGAYNQTFRMESGIDAEQVRHFFQNRLVHDMIIRRPDFKFPGNAHVPMLQPNGMPYLYHPDHRIRPVKWYFQTGMNDFMFY
ncbi:MAG: hypothetical protein JEZ14_08475 [Marinilabiliaceae bacterium]|nr:hypothetical protein [Marinilabiliaceae bacterium]